MGLGGGVGLNDCEALGGMGLLVAYSTKPGGLRMPTKLRVKFSIKQKQQSVIKMFVRVSNSHTEHACIGHRWV